MSHSPARRRTVIVGALVQVFALVIVSCGVPTGDSTFEAIDGEDIPNRLNDPTTTSTTTTTTTTTTTVPEVPEPTVESTTTTTEPPAPSESVEIYFISRGKLQPIPGTLPPLFGFNQLIALLEAGPPAGALGVGLDSFIEPGLIAGEPAAQRGVLTIDLDVDVFEEIIPRNQRAAIAQIVFTFLVNTTTVGQVSFTIGGEPFLAPTDAGRQELATVDDFSSLLPGGSNSTTTTTGPDDFEPVSATTTTGP
jgi:hypothetical protein